MLTTTIRTTTTDSHGNRVERIMSVPTATERRRPAPPVDDIFNSARDARRDLVRIAARDRAARQQPNRIARGALPVYEFGTL